MFEVIFIGILCGIIGYSRIQLVNAKVELTDLRIKYKFAQETLDAITENRNEKNTCEASIR